MKWKYLTGLPSLNEMSMFSFIEEPRWIYFNKLFFHKKTYYILATITEPRKKDKNVEIKIYEKYDLINKKQNTIKYLCYKYIFEYNLKKTKEKCENKIENLLSIHNILVDE
jgi:hypothetical protein